MEWLIREQDSAERTSRLSHDFRTQYSSSSEDDFLRLRSLIFLLEDPFRFQAPYRALELNIAGNSFEI